MVTFFLFSSSSVGTSFETTKQGKKTRMQTKNLCFLSSARACGLGSVQNKREGKKEARGKQEGALTEKASQRKNTHAKAQV